ncbi:hypothetical protein J6590_019021 [Homalodisca vitripennis]|nr:hypothetical protein J6590_019021 [Homalodisca vitripennis]
MVATLTSPPLTMCVDIDKSLPSLRADSIARRMVATLTSPPLTMSGDIDKSQATASACRS